MGNTSQRSTSTAKQKVAKCRPYSDGWRLLDGWRRAYVFSKVISRCLGVQAFINRVRFALYRRHGLTESLPCMVLFLVHEETHVARIVAQDQNGTALMEVARELSEPVSNNPRLTSL